MRDMADNLPAKPSAEYPRLIENSTRTTCLPFLGTFVLRALGANIPFTLFPVALSRPIRTVAALAASPGPAKLIQQAVLICTTLLRVNLDNVDILAACVVALLEDS